ncbi:MAG: isocitrate lyase/PEP mutase family protein, partial [Rhodospirillales bacterium]|nr:isocitrate lyase/PEP mutase family protein [Rhodospirillales bacterium]
MTDRPTWRQLLAAEKPLLLPVAHDALSARLIERAGFKAYSIGGYPLVGARHGIPDIGLVGLAEMSAGMRDIMAATSLPVMVDGDHGYGDVKNVTRTIQTYEALGASAIFIEDQVAPKRCGHLDGKEVVSRDEFTSKIRAAVEAR